MSPPDLAVAALNAFEPRGVEDEDITRLDEILDKLATLESVEAAVPAILGVFERFPGALLGAPGPLVHCIERIPVDVFLPRVLDSFGRRPARMTFWMIDRCLRGSLSPQLRLAALATLRKVRREPDTGLHDEIDELLADA